MQDRLANAEKAWRQYLTDYRKYWTNDIPEQLAIRADGWATLHRTFGATKPNQIQDALLNLGNRRADAFRKIGDEAAAQAATNALAVLNQPKFVGACRGRLANWTRVPAPLDEARERILGLTWPVLGSDYLMEPETLTPSFVEAYWQNLCQAGLKAIAGEVRKEANQAAADLLRLRRFPLAPTVAGDKQELTRDNVDQASELIRKIRARGDKAADSVAKAPPPGWATGELATAVDMLRSGATDLKADDQKWVDQVQRFLEARADPALTWSVRMLPPDSSLGNQLRQSIFYMRLNGQSPGNWLHVETGVSEELKDAPTATC